VATLELARLCDGPITALDIDQEALNRLKSTAESEGLSDRIHIIRQSMEEMCFPAHSFDIIWSEGAIAFIGFDRGLREWGALLRPGGCLVVHDVAIDAAEKVDLIASCGYALLGRFEITPDMWWARYFEPLKKQIALMRVAGTFNDMVESEIRTAEREIREFDRTDLRYGSMFFIVQKGYAAAKSHHTHRGGGA